MDKVKTIIKNTFLFPNLWGSIIPLQFIGAYGIYLLVQGKAPDWWWAGTIFGYILFTMIGISAGYHRLFCHKGYEVNKFTKRLLLWLAMMAGQGGPIYWIGIHKGYHHRYADTDKDSHSPKHGFWHSYILWMFTMNKMSLRSVTGLLRDPDMVFAHRYYQFIFWISHLVFALINFELWFWCMGFAAFVTLHVFLIQTSVTHLTWAGYRNYNVKDNSVNIPWLFPLLLGEAWHNNHHGNPRNPNYGGRRWWEIDPTYWIVKLIKSK